MNMIKKNDLERAKKLLSQVLSLTNNSDHRIMIEFKGHIKQAIAKLETIQKNKAKESAKNADFQNWWGHIQSGTANLATARMSAEAQNKSLSHLNKMIDDENNKLLELEKQQVPDQLIND